jgi:hypothetical protein
MRESGAGSRDRLLTHQAEANRFVEQDSKGERDAKNQARYQQACRLHADEPDPNRYHQAGDGQARLRREEVPGRDSNDKEPANQA